jgi:membrane-bound transcription factor site-1 protease
VYSLIINKFIRRIDLLEPFGIAYGDKIYESDFSIGDHVAYYASGSSLTKFPRSAANYVLYRELIDQSEDFLAHAANKSSLPSNRVNVPILGLAQFNVDPNAGRVVVFGDSNCIDSAHLTKGRLDSLLLQNRLHIFI